MGGASSLLLSLLPCYLGFHRAASWDPLLFLIYVNHVSSLNITDGSKITMYDDDILLFKPIDNPDQVHTQGRFGGRFIRTPLFSTMRKMYN